MTIPDAKKDLQTSTFEGKRTNALPHGSAIQPIATHTDARGSLFEIYNCAWTDHGEKVSHGTIVSIRAGWSKGWAIHMDHDDRYLVFRGEVEMCLYDEREDSPTKGLLSVFTLSEKNRQMLIIPRGVWHATENIGTEEAFFVNLPTAPYVYEDPDKYRLPLDTPRIPHRFHYGRGW
ncbi:MAG: cupin domain-containing protein [Verrucomicrobiales bacterium]